MSSAEAVPPVSMLKNRAGLLSLALLFCVIWASAFTAAKIGLADSPPKLFLGIRFVLAGILLLGLAGWREGWVQLTWRALALAALLGLLNNAIYLGFSHHAMARLSSGLVSVIISANPILTGLLAALLLREGLGPRRLIGLGLGLSGVWWILRHRIVMGDDPLGLAYAVAAVLSIVLGTVLFKRLGGGLGLIWSTGLQCLSAGLVLLPLGLWLEGIENLYLTPRFLGALAYQILMVSIGGYLIWLHLLRHVSATTASTYHFLIPPLGLGLGWLVLNEAVEPADLLGCLPIALGIYLVNRQPRP